MGNRKNSRPSKVARAGSVVANSGAHSKGKVKSARLLISRALSRRPRK